MDEVASELPEESYIHLGEDNMTAKKWISESLKGKAKELTRPKH